MLIKNLLVGLLGWSVGRSVGRLVGWLVMWCSCYLSAGARQAGQALPLQVEQPHLPVVVRDGDESGRAHAHAVHRRVRPDRGQRATHVTHIPHLRRGQLY